MKKVKMQFQKKLLLSKETIAMLGVDMQARVVGGVVSHQGQWCPGGPTRTQTENSAAPGCACCVLYSNVPICNTLEGPGGQCN